MKRFLRNKYTKLSKFIVAGSFVAISCLSAAPVALASGGGGSVPTLKFLSISSEFDANDCLYATVAGKHFTYTSLTTNSAVLSAGSNFDVTTILPIPPIPPMPPIMPSSTVNVGHDGNFEQLISICYNGDKASPITSVSGFTVSATDSNSNLTATTAPVNISDPQPYLHVTSNKVGLTNGCATVTVIGKHFLKSGVVENDATLQFYKGSATNPTMLLSQPMQLNVLGDGKIVIAASVCGLNKGDQFFVQATDQGSLFTTAPVALMAQ